MRRRFWMKRLVTSSMPLVAGYGSVFGKLIRKDIREGRLDAAVAALDAAVESRQVAAAVLHVARKNEAVTHCFGSAKSADSMFLLGSISKPVCVTALMTLFDQQLFDLDDRLRKFIPEFTGDGRDDVTIRHLLTHVSGLPDQLQENNQLRAKHAGLDEFIAHALRTPLKFQPGKQYEYSSMGILLATHIAERITGKSISEFVDETVFRPLSLRRSAQGTGLFRREDFVDVQTESAAPESGGGDPNAASWDWNSTYWRNLGAPWGGTHMSAPDVARFLNEFLHAGGAVIKPETAQMMIRNHNPEGLTPRGLGFLVGAKAGSRGCSERTFGHTGSTGTLAWADPETDTICVVLTSLPGQAVRPHPREVAGDAVAKAVA
jgi:CubicO group peptidase (beta-lactamase class C family)